MDTRLVQSVQTYNCSFILLAWYHGVWHACPQGSEFEAAGPRNGDVPSAHAASWPCSCRIQSWAYGLGWQNGPLSMYPLASRNLHRTPACHWPYWPKSSQTNGVIEVVLDSLLWDPWSPGGFGFFSKTRGLFSITTSIITRELCQGFVHQAPSPSNFEQDFNSYTALPMLRKKCG